MTIVNWSTVVYSTIIQDCYVPDALLNPAGERNLNWLQHLPAEPELVFENNVPEQRELAKRLMDAMQQGLQGLSSAVQQSSGSQPSSGTDHPAWVQPTLEWLRHIIKSEIPYPAYLLHAATKMMPLEISTEGYAMARCRDSQTWNETEHSHLFLAGH
jgi:hypothetical protein